MTYEDILFKLHYLHAKAMNTADCMDCYHMKLKWELSRDVFEILKEGITVYCSYKDTPLELNLNGIPVEIIEDEVNYIKLFIEVE